MDTTSNASLSERYVRAVGRAVPERQREEVTAELRERIADETDARIAAGEAAEAAEYGVLKELGDPGQLASVYIDRPMHLIGPAYYLAWRRLLKLVLWCGVLPTAVVLAIIQSVQGKPVWEVIGGAVWIAIEVSVHIFFWVTIIIVIVERTSRSSARSPLDVWTPEMLPQSLASGTSVTKGELVANLATVVWLAGLLLWDHFLGFVPWVWGVSILDPSLWPWWFGGAFVVLALQVVLAVGNYRRGRWTIGSATLNLFLILTVAGGVIWLVSQDRLINPDFGPTVAGDAGWIVDLCLNIVAVCLVMGIGALGAWDGYRRARQSDC